MKTYKKTIICMIILCIIFFTLSLILEFDIFIKVNRHKEYLENIFLGGFASGLLVLIPSMVSYFCEKRQYYLDIYTIANRLLSCSIEIMKYMEEFCQDRKLLSSMFDTFSIYYNDLISRYSCFAYFFHLSQRDKVIESILNEITKYSLIQQELLKLSKDLNTKKINLETYTNCFKYTKKELIETYMNTFVKYQDFIKKDINNFIGNRKLKTYIR